jgi:hypothetical protein
MAPALKRFLFTLLAAPVGAALILQVIVLAQLAYYAQEPEAVSTSLTSLNDAANNPWAVFLFVAVLQVFFSLLYLLAGSYAPRWAVRTLVGVNLFQLGFYLVFKALGLRPLVDATGFGELILPGMVVLWVIAAAVAVVSCRVSFDRRKEGGYIPA